MWAKQSTAVSYIVGPILDSTGAEYASAVIGDLSISKNGGTLTAMASAATLTYIANGQYTLAMTTGNTDTPGTFRVSVNKATYQMPPMERMVLPATVYDALTTNATNATGGFATATATITALSGAVSTFAGGAVASVTAGVTLAASQHVIVDSGTVTTLTNLPSIPANWITAAGITAAALNGKGDWLLSSSYTTPPTAVQNRQEMDSNSVGLGAIFARTDVATSSRMATYTQPTGFLAATFPSGTVANTTNITAGTLTTVTTATNVTTVNGLAANVITAASIAADADAELAASVWDLATSGHTTSGTFGAAMSAAGAAGDPWSTSLPGSYGSGTAGNIVGNRIDAAVSTRLPIESYTTPPTAVANADALLGRNVAGGSSTGRTVSEALYVLRNKVAISGSTMTVYSTDDSTTSWSAALTAASGASPISVVDPG